MTGMMRAGEQVNSHCICIGNKVFIDTGELHQQNGTMIEQTQCLEAVDKLGLFVERIWNVPVDQLLRLKRVKMQRHTNSRADRSVV